MQKNIQIPCFIIDLVTQELLLTTLPIYGTRKKAVFVQLHLLQGMRGGAAGHLRVSQGPYKLH